MPHADVRRTRKPVPYRVVDRQFDTLIAWATRISPRMTWTITLLAILAVGMVDYVTDPVIWFGPIYLLIVCLPTWTLGPRAGYAAGLICMATSLIANGISDYPISHVGLAWNLAMRVLSVCIIVALVGGFRRSYNREWQRARSDALTGVLNKQAFDECAAACRRAWAVLAYVDLDGFKQINDRLGHAAGDELLRGFAAGVRGNIRATDIFARNGGDEFLLFLPAENETEGYRLANQLHARMNDVLHGMGPLVSCSMGALVLVPEQAGLDGADIDLADRLMYEAKHAGGAAVRIATKGAPGLTGAHRQRHSVPAAAHT